IICFQVLQSAPQLAGSPSRMLAAQGHNPFLHRDARPTGTFLRAARLVNQPLRTLMPIALHPLISAGRANAKTTAQLPDIVVGLKSKVHKLKSNMHQIFHRPGHRSDTLPASASKCPPCPRTPVHYVPGPYTGEGQGERDSTITSPAATLP